MLPAIKAVPQLVKVRVAFVIEKDSNEAVELDKITEPLVMDTVSPSTGMPLGLQFKSTCQ